VRFLYHLGCRFFRNVLKQTVRVRFVAGGSSCKGGFLLACTHTSHLDPIIASILLRPHINWMARAEFYGTWWSRCLLHGMGAFSVKRQGVPVKSLKLAIRLAEQGKVVGICPEGEVRRDATSVLRKGSIKQGVCLVAQHSGRPVIPCLVLGTEALLSARAYTIRKPCRLWLGCGNPIYAPTGVTRREGRRIMGRQIEQALRDLHADFRQQGLTSSLVTNYRLSSQ